VAELGVDPGGAVGAVVGGLVEGLGLPLVAEKVTSVVAELDKLAVNTEEPLAAEISLFKGPAPGSSSCWYISSATDTLNSRAPVISTIMFLIFALKALQTA